MSRYEDISLDKPFRILLKNKDATVWKKDGRGLLIYFHDLKAWVNPPTDSNLESRAVGDIERCGVEYLAKEEEL